MREPFPSPSPGFLDPLTANNPFSAGMDNSLFGAGMDNSLFGAGIDLGGFSDRFGQGFVQGGVQGTNILLSPAPSPMGPSIPSNSNPSFFPMNPLTLQGQRVLPPNVLPKGPMAPQGPNVPFDSQSMGVGLPTGIFNGPSSSFHARGGPLGGVFPTGNIFKKSFLPKKPLNMLVKPKKLVKLPSIPLKY